MSIYAGLLILQIILLFLQFTILKESVAVRCSVRQ